MDLSTVHSLWLAPLCMLLGAGLAWWLYRPREGRDEMPRKLALALGVARALVIALVAFFLLEPMVRILIREVRKPVVVIAHDGSSSLLLAGDTAAVRGPYMDQLNDLASRLSDRYEVRTFTYGDGVSEGLDRTQSAALTDMGELLREVRDRLSGPDLGAVILDGDGIYNRGRDPRLDATRLGVPVHTIALGDTTVRPDLVVKDVEHNRINYLGNEFPLLVRLEARHFKGGRSRLVVLHDGREVAARDVAFTADPFFTEVPLTLKAERSGLQRYTVLLRPLDGEATEANNAQDVIIDVLDGRQKVLLLGLAPHPDLGAIRSALDGLDGYGTTLAYASSVGDAIEEYDLIILHQLPSARYGLQGLLQRAAARSIPVCAIVGAGTDLQAFNALGCGVQVTEARGTFTDAQAMVDRNFTAFTMEDEVVDAIERFPPLQVVFGQYAMSRSASALVTQRVGVVRTQHPLIAVVQQGDRRMATICGEGLWRWRLADHQRSDTHRHFDLLIHKLVQYLALKVDKNRFRVEHAATFNANEAVLFHAELYNASYEPVNTADVRMVLRDESGKEYTYAFNGAGSAYRLDAGRLPAGRYTWQARTSLQGENFSSSGEVVVRALVTEQLSAVADHGLLADIAARTGGLMVGPADLGAIERSLLEGDAIPARSYSHASFSDLIGIHWIFYLLLALLTLEWVVRRRSGTY